MARRGENIYKRKDGRWEGRVLKLDGTYQYVYAKTYKSVKEKKNQLQQQTEEKDKRVSSVPENAVDLFESWLTGGLSGRVRPTTFESYYRCLTQYVIPFFRESGDARITELGVLQFVHRINSATTLSEAYRRKIISIFKTALKEILSGSDQYTQILNAVRLPKAESTPVQVFSLKEQRLIENAAMNSEDRRALGILLCFYTGIRLGELCALKWGDIDFEAGTMSVARTVSRVSALPGEAGKSSLRVGMPKSVKSVRKIPLPAFLMALAINLKMHVAEESCYLLSGSDLPPDPRAYQKLFKKILNEAGVKDRKFHAIRHTFATRSLELGVDIKTLSEILGHANVSITLNIYAHSLMEQKRIAIEKLNDMHMQYMKSSLFAVAGAVTPA